MLTLLLATFLTTPKDLPLQIAPQIYAPASYDQSYTPIKLGGR